MLCTFEARMCVVHEREHCSTLRGTCLDYQCHICTTCTGLSVCGGRYCHVFPQNFLSSATHCRCDNVQVLGLSTLYFVLVQAVALLSDVDGRRCDAVRHVAYPPPAHVPTRMTCRLVHRARQDPPPGALLTKFVTPAAGAAVSSCWSCCSDAGCRARPRQLREGQAGIYGADGDDFGDR